jgi:hypothetical protein
MECSRWCKAPVTIKRKKSPEGALEGTYEDARTCSTHQRFSTLIL